MEYVEVYQLSISAQFDMEASFTVLDNPETKPTADRACNPSGDTITKTKLYMDRKTNIFLNINACILIGVFVFLYCLFG